MMDVKRGGEESELDYDSDDEDGPVIVPMEEIQESINRSDNIQLHHTGTSSSHNSKLHRYRERYPFLFAAISMDEDILMTCARILDDQRDVTLVREAAAYLEEVEAKRQVESTHTIVESRMFAVAISSAQQKIKMNGRRYVFLNFLLQQVQLTIKITFLAHRGTLWQILFKKEL